MIEKNQENEMHWQAFVLFLKEIAKEKKINAFEISKKTGYSASTIYRIFNLEFCPKLQIFLEIIKVLEINVFFKDRENKTELNILFEKAMYDLGRRPKKMPKN